MRRIAALATACLLVQAAQATTSLAETPPVDTRVFVGRLLEIEQQPDHCEEEASRTGVLACITMDRVYRARYVVEQDLTGTRVGEEIAFTIADHYGYPRMALQPHALLFVAGNGQRRWLHRYQGFAVQRTTDGGWAACGQVFAASAGAPAPRPLAFAGDFGAVGATPASSLGQQLQPGDYTIEDGRMYCRRGLPLAELYEGARKGLLGTGRVLLPAWNVLHEGAPAAP